MGAAPLWRARRLRPVTAGCGDWWSSMPDKTSQRCCGKVGGIRVVVSVAAGVLVILAGVWLANRARPSAERPGETTAARFSDLVEAGQASGFNVLLVTLDTVRADRIGCYGHELAETPTIDSLVERGVRFDDAVASAPITLPSHATILTGLSPLSHGVHDNGRYRLADEHVTLAEVLSSHGYDTAAFIGCFVLDARFGLDQGFDVYDFEVSESGHRPEMPDFNERSASDVTDAAVRWLGARADSGTDAPFFGWVHYFDPHLPYRSPFQRLTRFRSRPYDAEIAYVDAEIGRLLSGLDEAGERARTLVVVAGDHGEGLGEHGESTHGMLIYESTVRVPLVLSCAALFDGAYRVDDRVVGLTDIKPTVERLLGIDGAPPLDGKNLLGPGDDEDRAVYIETEMPLSFAGWSPLSGLRTHSHKYILAPSRELYDLRADPAESRNAYLPDDPVVVSLESQLSALMSEAETDRGAGRSLTDEEIERLGSLGYVQSGAVRAEGPLPDPKTMMSVYSDAVRSEQLYARGAYSEAADLAASVIDRSGMHIQALRVLAFSYVKLGRADEAVGLLRDSTEKNPDAFLVRSLVQVLILEQRYADALDALDVYESIDPLDGRVPLLRGDIAARQGQDGLARVHYEESMRLDEHRVGRTARERIVRLGG